MSYLGKVDMNDADIKHYSLTSSTLTVIPIGWVPASEQSLRVTINGVVQQGDTFSYSGSNLTLGGPLVATDTLEVVGIESVGNIITPADNSVTTTKLADDAVTLAKMAGLVRGKIIVGDASGDPSALTVGGATTVLTSDGTDAAWAAAAAGGKVLQVLWHSLNTDINTTSTSYVASGLTVTMTPASTSSKFLLTLAGGQQSQSVAYKELLTTFYVDTGSGAAEVSDTGPYSLHRVSVAGYDQRGVHSAICLHAPSTVSAVTYTVYFKTSSTGTGYFNITTCRVQFSVMELSS